MSWVLGTVCLGAGLMVGGGALWYLRRCLNRLDRMLDQALSGTFSETEFSESRFSRLEYKLKRFLSASQLSKTRTEEERGRIKSLIGDISHQTRTPISNIQLYAELLKEQPLPPEAAEMAERIDSQSRKLGFLIQSLVKLSRLESGVVQVRPQKEQVSRLCSLLRDTYGPKAEEKGISLEWSCSGEETAAFDLKWTGEAVGNLLDNSIKYTPAGGKIRVYVRQYEMFCRIDVADTGIGIREEEMPKIFGRFYRSPQVQEQEGVGVGLFLARQIISAQEGYIRVRSVLGQGSVFSVYLPVDG